MCLVASTLKGVVLKLGELPQNTDTRAQIQNKRLGAHKSEHLTNATGDHAAYGLSIKLCRKKRQTKSHKNSSFRLSLAPKLVPCIKALGLSVLLEAWP